MKLYENVAIGNFLYGLGFAIAQRVKRTSFPSMVNLLQQTPDDQVLGDLLMRFPGVLRIMEFKQRDNIDDKEPKRHQRLNTVLGNSERRIRTSREVHWFVETAPTEDSFVSRVVPYLDAYPRDNSRHDFASFINATADAAVRGESDCTPDDLEDYLAFLASCHKSGEVGSGGLIVRMTPDGGLKYVELTSFMDLRISREGIVSDLLRREEKALQLERQRDHQMEQTTTMSIDRGGREIG